METIWDCIVVGGGAAGLSAALVLGRARRRTLVVDGGRPSNAPAHGIGGLLGHDGRPPAELYATGRVELTAYPSVDLVPGEVAGGRVVDDGFELDLADGVTHRARRVVLAMGMDYRFADVPGLAERWGRTVFHCPFCHGWEVRDQRLGVLDGSPEGLHRAHLLRLWSDDVTLLTNGPHGFSDDECAGLAANGIALDARPVAGVEGAGDALAAVTFADGPPQPIDGLLVAITMHQRSSLATQLGAATSAGPVSADAVDVDAFMQTSVPGLFAAGDTSTQMPSVAAAIAAGSAAGAAVVRSFLASA